MCMRVLNSNIQFPALKYISSLLPPPKNIMSQPIWYLKILIKFSLLNPSHSSCRVSIYTTWAFKSDPQTTGLSSLQELIRPSWRQILVSVFLYLFEVDLIMCDTLMVGLWDKYKYGIIIIRWFLKESVVKRREFYKRCCVYIMSCM